ncbi:hypothetical protein L228DRAFT_240169 [Xylona heveae TC161]|uniref:Uncharacterized protein n=1 Tax=Xylona heveae (strain CBS 132557 / TC161) TaxID=1328760 RepID=A0A165FS24_XYLHT|nr:hypothetical protein L228DRAFT_240169 [Xylona heveae TC161]KZF21307.1 hypothetical protein L228DRAFT_240169 [Xylona heveae TC161]
MYKQRLLSSEPSGHGGRTSSSSYVHYGIGGAGNYHRLDHPLPPIPRSPVPAWQDRPGIYSSGIGGAGNMRSSKDRPTISPEESLARFRLQEIHKPRSYYIGIGGLGNRASNHSSSSSSSSSSVTGVKSIALSFELARKLVKRAAGNSAGRKRSNRAHIGVAV